MKNKATVTSYKSEPTANEGLYRTLFENVHDGIYRSTPDGRILTANPALVRMLGYESEEELKNLNIGKDIYVSKVERDSFIDLISREGRLKDTELLLRRKDGSTIIVLENAHSVRSENGEILYYEGSLVDITERKKAEEALRESENRYHTLIDTLQDGVSLFDFGGRLIYFNQQKKKMLGYESDEEMFRVNTFEMIHPDDRQKAQKIFRDLMNKGSITQKELRIVRKDGSFFWAEFGASLVKDSSGIPVQIMDSMRDISHRRKSQENLMVLKHSVDFQYDGVYWTDPANRIVYVNDAACRQTGYRENELLGAEVTIINPQATSEVMKLVWEKLRKNGSFSAEAIHRKKNGTEFPVEIISTYVKTGGKEYNCAFARDITERKKAAEEMKLRIEQLRQIIDLVPSYIFAKDIDGRFLLANKALADVFGLSPDEIQGKNDSDYGATREQVQWYRKHDMEVIKKGCPVAIPEEQVLRKDGTLGWFQTVKIPYRHPGYPKPAILGVATDITDRRNTEIELGKSERRFRKLFESHSAVKLIIDPATGDIIDANRAAAEFYCWPVSKLRKMNIQDISMTSADVIKQRFEKASVNRGHHFESVNILADGTFKDVEVFLSKIEIDGSYYFHSIVHDITEKKKIFSDLVAAKEKAEESDRLKTAFLHNISHEIRTPMNAIVGFTSLLESPGLPEDTKKQYIDIIFNSSNQLLAIISDIVDISNIETGHVKISLSDVKPADFIKRLNEQFLIRAKTLGLKLKPVIPENNSKTILRTDETKLVQIISNLLNNALKFTIKGYVEFGYECKKDEIEFFVRDTGKGIKPHELEKVFDRFYQADFTPNQKTEGTGLGLAICKGYTEILGGKIWAISEPGKGAEFRFTLPYGSATRPSEKKAKPGRPDKK